MLTDYRLKFYQLLERLYNKEEKYDQDFYQKKKKKREGYAIKYYIEFLLKAW